jgi:ABC-type branched-subunit amino acid transport system ATPase component
MRPRLLLLLLDEPTEGIQPSFINPLKSAGSRRPGRS